MQKVEKEYSVQNRRESSLQVHADYDGPPHTHTHTYIYIYIYIYSQRNGMGTESPLFYSKYINYSFNSLRQHFVSLNKDTTPNLVILL